MKDLILARENLVSGVTLSLVSGDSVIIKRERGVLPLLELFDTGRDFSSYSAADRVVGLGAAYLYLSLGIKKLYTIVISEAAYKKLVECGVYIEYDTITERIINRRGDGGCPIEETVKDTKNVDEAITLIRKKLSELIGDNK